jgi:phage baseplate assembly protein gpV
MELYYGMVEDRHDPLGVGRVRVRVHGIHTHDKQQIASADLPWSSVIMPTTEASLSGIGKTTHGLIEGSTVIGVFTDNAKQNFIVLGSSLGIPSSGARKDIKNKLITPSVEDGFNDPRRLTATDYDDTPDGINPVQDPSRSWGLTAALDKAPKHPKSVEIKLDGTASTITEKTLTTDDLPYYPLYRDQTDVSDKAINGSEPTYKPTTLSVFELPEKTKDTTATQYPYNKVTETESGHYFSVDDTPGRERIVDFHRSGTYKEIWQDGDEVHRVVNDHYEVICKDDHLYIGGSAIVHVESGNVTINVVKGNANITVGGDTNITSTGNINMTAPTVAIDAEVTVTKNIVAEGEVTGKGIELSTHVHTEQGDGKDVSKPK